MSRPRGEGSRGEAGLRGPRKRGSLPSRSPRPGGGAGPRGRADAGGRPGMPVQAPGYQRAAGSAASLPLAARQNQASGPLPSRGGSFPPLQPRSLHPPPASEGPRAPSASLFLRLGPAPARLPLALRG
ncbi:hypothetical protein KIL84_005411 [Mauremys mutica]|uniref:Uncharacterized protein n=1 Tax=Mauremys mutica TaxID=74926 RepID=A0A9D3XMA5_9SAUR|nr:hypothetical protein KIL84_005411 [Mauremys mutica]